MKNFLFILTAFTVVTFFYSCSDDDKAPGITAINLAGSSTLNLLPGESIPLSSLFQITPSKASFSELNYIVANPSIAVVEGNVIKFVSNGQTTLKATAYDGTIESPVITVICSSPVTAINTLTEEIILSAGDNVELSGYFSVEPSTASVASLNYTVENEAVAKVEDGKLVYIAAGTTTVTAHATDDSGVSSDPINVVCSEDRSEVPAQTEWTATASKYFDKGAANTDTQETFMPLPSCAIDGDQGTFWQSALDFGTFEEAWLLVDLSAVSRFSSVTVLDRENNNLAFDVYLSSSNQGGIDAGDASFRKVGSGTDTQTTVSFEEQNARYVKVVVTEARLRQYFYQATITDIILR